MKLDRRDFLRASLLAGVQALAGPALELSRFGLLAETAADLPAPPYPLETLPGVSTRAAELVRRATVIDMLGLLTLDWPQLYAWQSEPALFGQAEVARLRASGIGVFHPAVEPSEPDPPEAVRRWLAGWNRLLDHHPRSLLRIDRAADLVRLKTEGKIGLLLGFQNSDHFRTADDVALFYDLGQRVSQLTYNARNRIGSGCQDPHDRGLTRFGGEIVAAMNRAGMAIDVSHCSERTSLDAIAASAKPVLVTHSNCRALVRNRRCKSDRVIRALAARGGVFGVTVLPMMLRNGAGAAIGDVLDHFDHVAGLVGPSHVGLGSDTDLDAVDPRTHRVRPAYRVHGLQLALRVYELTEGLLRRGYGEPEVEGILGRNFQRALDQIWSA